MGILRSLHNKLNREEPADRNSGLLKASLAAAFAFLILAGGVMYFAITANADAVKHIFFIKYLWLLFIVAAVSCLSIGHYFHYTNKIKVSISGGVTMFMFVQILINALMFYMIFAYLHAAPK